MPRRRMRADRRVPVARRGTCARRTHSSPPEHVFGRVSPPTSPVIQRPPSHYMTPLVLRSTSYWSRVSVRVPRGRLPSLCAAVGAADLFTQRLETTCRPLCGATGASALPLASAAASSGDACRPRERRGTRAPRRAGRRLTSRRPRDPSARLAPMNRYIMHDRSAAWSSDAASRSAGSPGASRASAGSSDPCDAVGEVCEDGTSPPRRIATSRPSFLAPPSESTGRSTRSTPYSAERGTRSSRRAPRRSPPRPTRPHPEKKNRPAPPTRRDRTDHLLPAATSHAHRAVVIGVGSRGSRFDLSVKSESRN